MPGYLIGEDIGLDTDALVIGRAAFEGRQSGAAEPLYVAVSSDGRVWLTGAVGGLASHVGTIDGYDGHGARILEGEASNAEYAEWASGLRVLARRAAPALGLISA